MKIGIIGTRGIPNRYGGFEEFAEQVCLYWADNGHDVFVYCEEHLNIEPFEHVNVERVFIQTLSIIGLSQFLYDYRCTRHAVLQDLDIVYHAGYATSVIGNSFFRRKLKGKLVYNMDGLEWKRSKFSRITRWLIKILERTAAKSGAELVADNKGIQDYLKLEYDAKSTLIEYGAEVLNSKIKSFDGYPQEFDLVIARIEPENNVEKIIMVYENNPEATLILVGNSNTHFFEKLSSRLNKANNIIFKGPIYDKKELAFLRTNCRFYLHGHSVGGTNPSLLEALAAGCNILIHDNIFNKDVVQDHALSWSDEKELEKLLYSNCRRLTTVESQKSYCAQRFNWDLIAQKHLDLFEKITSNKFSVL